MTDKEKKIDTAAPSGHVPRSALAAVAGRVEMAGSLPGSPETPARAIAAPKPLSGDMRRLVPEVADPALSRLLPPEPRRVAVDPYAHLFGRVPMTPGLLEGQPDTQKTELVRHAGATSLQATSMTGATKLPGGIK